MLYILYVFIGLYETSATIGQILHSCRDRTCTPQPIALMDAETPSETAFHAKNKTDGKASKLHHRASHPGSAISLKSARNSFCSLDQGKVDGKQKLDKILKEKVDKKVAVDLDPPPAIEVLDGSKIYPYQVYNTILYGLPNFITSLPG